MTYQLKIRPLCSNGSDDYERSTQRILDPLFMNPLSLEKQVVFADEVFHNEKVWRSFLEYSKNLRQLEALGLLTDEVKKINTMSVQDNFVPEYYSHQETIGKNIKKQAEIIRKTDFFKAITAHPDFKTVPGYETPEKILIHASHMMNILRNTWNVFRKEKLYAMLGSTAEVKTAFQFFCKIWPAGVDLYEILREMYPLFHARATGQIPVRVVENLDELIHKKVSSKDVMGIGRFVIDDESRMLGLYPVVELPEEWFYVNETYVSQDQVARKAIADRIFDDAAEIMMRSKNKKVVVIDYAGGVGNISELLLKKIYLLEDTALKAQLMKRLRSVVIDVSTDQLSGGQNRFYEIAKRPEYKDIHEKIVFIHGDVTNPLNEEQLAEIKRKFGEDFIEDNPVFLGMTAYTIGALNNLLKPDGRTYSEAAADEMSAQCWKIYAVDFSSPAWRLNDFLKDTGKWGEEYLRGIHGVANSADRTTNLSRVVAAGLKVLYGISFKNVAEFVKYMAGVNGLASHYLTAWPGSDGHNAGYSILEDGTLKKPGILSFAEHLQKNNIRVNYKSKVWLFAANDLGRISSKNRAYFLMPGWVGDFVVAENEMNRPFDISH